MAGVSAFDLRVARQAIACETVKRVVAEFAQIAQCIDLDEGTTETIVLNGLQADALVTRIESLDGIRLAEKIIKRDGFTHLSLPLRGGALDRILNLVALDAIRPGHTALLAPVIVLIGAGQRQFAQG
ncbi:hypothetical protein, partial [Pseudomonas syringae]|uniref:hypothetical protein n=1 Tax=Pseudomonas syringae TaxID=317 RepID=UPI00137A4115